MAQRVTQYHSEQFPLDLATGLPRTMASWSLDAFEGLEYRAGDWASAMQHLTFLVSEYGIDLARGVTHWQSSQAGLPRYRLAEGDTLSLAKSVFES